MEQLTSSEAMVAWADARRAEGRVIGLVPTMGFLHDGHASLMAMLRPRCDLLVTSIFVNPLQFGAGEDLDVYPRDLEGDLARCREEEVDAVFCPSVMYPPDFSTSVRVDGLTARLCGASRPTHFEGVTTVVSRLFGLTRCQLAAFGEKDFQQLMVLRRMVRDLALPVTLVPGAIVRDTDGLALSSRNAFLAPEERARAAGLHQALFALRDACRAGQTDAQGLVDLARARVDCDRLDYLELVDAESLQPIERVERPARALVAAFYGRTRLIDNVAVGPELSWT